MMRLLILMALCGVSSYGATLGYNDTTRRTQTNIHLQAWTLRLAESNGLPARFDIPFGINITNLGGNVGWTNSVPVHFRSNVFAISLDIDELFLDTPVLPASGGTGRDSYTAGAIPIGNGTNAMGEVLLQSTAYGASWNANTNLADKNSIYDEMELRAPKASPIFTGVPSGPTAAFGANSEQLATTEFVQDAVAEIEAGTGVPGITGSGSTTNNDDFLTLYTYTFAATNRSAQLNAHVLGAGPTNIYGFNVAALVKNIAGTVEVVGTNNSYIIPTSGTNVTSFWDASGDTARLRVRGTASENINWVATNILVNVVTNGLASVVSVTYLFEEDWEGTGLPAGWATSLGSPDYDYVTFPAPLRGVQSARFLTSDHAFVSFASQSTLEVYLLLNVSIIPVSTTTIFGIRTSGDANVAAVQIDLSGAIGVFSNGSLSNLTGDTLAAGTTYHVWLRWTSGGTSTVEFNTTGTRTGGGSKFTSKDTSYTGTAERFRLGSGAVIITDRVLGLNGVIGSNP